MGKSETYIASVLSDIEHTCEVSPSAVRFGVYMYSHHVAQ